MCCYYNSKSQCYKLADDVGSEMSDDLDHDRGGGLDAGWRDEESDGDDDGIAMEAADEWHTSGTVDRDTVSRVKRRPGSDDIG